MYQAYGIRSTCPTHIELGPKRYRKGVIGTITLLQVGTIYHCHSSADLDKFHSLKLPFPEIS